jgi:hypothetical protein
VLFMMRREVRTVSTAPFLGVQLESNGVMLPKFHSDPVAHHK